MFKTYKKLDTKYRIIETRPFWKTHTRHLKIEHFNCSPRLKCFLRVIQVPKSPFLRLSRSQGKRLRTAYMPAHKYVMCITCTCLRFKFTYTYMVDLGLSIHFHNSIMLKAASISVDIEFPVRRRTHRNVTAKCA